MTQPIFDKQKVSIAIRNIRSIPGNIRHNWKEIGISTGTAVSVRTAFTLGSVAVCGTTGLVPLLVPVVAGMAAGMAAGGVSEVLRQRKNNQLVPGINRASLNAFVSGAKSNAVRSLLSGVVGVALSDLIVSPMLQHSSSAAASATAEASNCQNPASPMCLYPQDFTFYAKQHNWTGTYFNGPSLNDGMSSVEHGKIQAAFVDLGAKAVSSDPQPVTVMITDTFKDGKFEYSLLENLSYKGQDAMFRLTNYVSEMKMLMVSHVADCPDIQGNTLCVVPPIPEKGVASISSLIRMVNGTTVGQVRVTPWTPRLG